MVLSVDVVHHLLEHGAMGRRVLQLVEADEVVNHFMNHRVFNLFLRHVDARVEAQPEIVVLHPSVLSPALPEGANAQERLGIAELDGDSGEIPRKTKTVELIKLLLYVWNGGPHLCFYQDIQRRN